MYIYILYHAFVYSTKDDRTHLYAIQVKFKIKLA